MIIKRRIEITAVERERVIRQFVALPCPVCQLKSEMLTAAQAGVLAQVKVSSIYRWLAQGRAHGVKTAGGHHRICRHSLFRVTALTPD